ncbi:Protein of unknown function [Gryllus bimaculatus]|nr:Protein of unknown function [Gryllus bimaculatus]
MVRAQRKCVKIRTNTTRSIPCQDNVDQNSQKDKKLNTRWECVDKSATGNNLEKAVVLLEDIAVHSSRVSKRNILGDKTNHSPMSPTNQKPRKFNRSTDQKSHQKMSCNLPGRITEGRSPYKLSDSRNQHSAKKSLLGVLSSEENLQNQPKSSQFSDKCIYTKVQRETLRNKNMPREEKLAQYDFEIDENEPVVKKKKKRNVTRRKKVKSKEVYYPPSKVFQKIFQAGVEEAEEKIKGKPKDAANAKSKFDFFCEDNCTDQTIGCEVQGNSLPPLVRPSNREISRSFSENVSPDGRPESQIEKRNVGSGKVNTDANISKPNISLCEKSIPNLVQGVSVVSCTSKVMPTAENRYNNKSDLFKSPNQHLASSFGNTVSTPVGNNVKDARFSLSEVTSTSTPAFQSTPLNSNSQAAMNASHFANECSMNHSVNWIKRVSFVPRESGGFNNSCENVVAEDWSVDNCFGFDDGSEEPVELSPPRDISSKQRMRNKFPMNNANSFSNKRKYQLKKKETEISPVVKRKCGLTALVSPNKSFKLGITDKSSSSGIDKSNASINTSTQECSERELDTSVIGKPSSVVAGLSPFSKSLKQTKLDFLAVESNTSTYETPKKDEESPLLFKDLDKTPIHFKEPARRSYVRSVRKKLKRVGCEWIEIDSESEEAGESSHHSSPIKRKKVKLNKNEAKEANKWMKDFNRQCEEIEGFELCVEN